MMYECKYRYVFKVATIIHKLHSIQNTDIQNCIISVKYTSGTVNNIRAVSGVVLDLI